MAEILLNKAVNQLPQVVIFGPDANEKKIVAISQDGLDANVTASFSISPDGVRDFPLLEENGNGGFEQKTLNIARNVPTSGIIIKDCPAPYLHIKLTSSIGGAGTGTITVISCD